MRLELQTVIAVIQPDTGGRDPFPRGNHRGVTDDRDQIAVPSGFDAQDAESVLGVVEGDALHEASQNLVITLFWLAGIGGHLPITRIVVRSVAHWSHADGYARHEHP